MFINILHLIFFLGCCWLKYLLLLCFVYLDFIKEKKMTDIEKSPNDSETSYACKDCNTVFQEASEFHKHACEYADRIENPEASDHHVKCEICGNMYSKRYLVQHLRIHNETLDFTCSICNKQFKSKLRLKCHFHAHTARYKCDVCGKGFGESGNLKKHMRIHSGERPFVCTVCNKSFTQKRHLQDHKVTHNGECDLDCDVCGRKFLNRSALKVHKFCHETEFPFGCKECNACFPNEESLKAHACNQEEKPYVCNFCDESFKEHYLLKDHLALHRADHQPFACELCKKTFHKFAILKIHMQSHSKERNHVCHLCNKAFKTFNVLRKHCLLHTGERNKICEICNKSFKCNNTLRTHYLTHTDERPFGCEICGKTFKRITPLQNHLTTHTGELPYPCDVCGKRFARKSTLENHIILHTGERPYICLICQKTFTRKSSLKIHHTTVHMKEEQEVPKNINNSGIHLLAGDMARHAILLKHTFGRNPNGTMGYQNIPMSFERGNSDEAISLKGTDEGKCMSSDSSSECSGLNNVEIEFSDTNSMESSKDANSEFSNNYICKDCNTTFQEASEFHNHACERAARSENPGGSNDHLNNEIHNSSECNDLNNVVSEFSNANSMELSESANNEFCNKLKSGQNENLVEMLTDGEKPEERITEVAELNSNDTQCTLEKSPIPNVTHIKNEPLDEQEQVMTN